MRLNTIRIPCENLEESLAYYAVALAWPRTFGSISEGFVGFSLGDVNVMLEVVEPGEFESGRYLGFSVSVEDIHGYYLEARQRGVRFTGPPTTQSWGGVMTHIEDCSGNTFSIVETSPS